MRRAVILPIAIATILLTAVPGYALTQAPGATLAGAKATGARDYFPVPEAALVRPIGDIAHGSCAPRPSAQVCQGDTATNGGPIQGNSPVAVPGLGIPVGGVGAGSFMVNQSGTFGPWNFGGQQGSSWETRALPQAAFHVRESGAAETAVTRTLAAAGPDNEGTTGRVRERSWESPLPAWNNLKPGEGDYAALYPFGWMSYKPFRTDISMRFYSPIVAKEDKRTSLPLVYFDVRMANHTAETKNLSVMFTMPNAPAHDSTKLADQLVTPGPTSVRTGLASKFTNSNGVQAVTLSADDARNTPDAARTEWTIAARPSAGQKVSYATSWNGSGDGSDIYAPFTATGALPNAALDTSSSAGALAVKLTLAPGEIATVPFALSWDFPQVGFSDFQTIWMKRYTNFYGAKTTATNDYVAGSYPSGQGFNIARDALLGAASALTAVEKWWKPIATDPMYPAPLRMAALNNLSNLVFSNSFWEGGLVSNTLTPTGFSAAGPGNHLGARRPDSHLFAFQDTGAGGVSGMISTKDIQIYNYRAYYSLFPNLFRDTLSAEVEATLLAGNKNAADLFVTTNSGSPFILWGNKSTDALQSGTDSRPPAPGQTQWGDSPGKFVFAWYGFSKIAKDPQLLREAWPAMKAEIAYLQATIVPGTHLPLDSGIFANIYNVVPQTGLGLYNSELYLLALTAAIETGRTVGADPAYILTLSRDLAAAKSEFELAFWDPVAKNYRYSVGGAFNGSVFVDSFFAQHLAASAGLPDLVDPDHYREQLVAHRDDLKRYNAQHEYIGVAMLSQPLSAEVPLVNVPPQIDEVWVGPAYIAAADYITAGRRFDDPRLTRFGVDLSTAVATQIWLRPDNGFAFNPPISWSAKRTDQYTYPAYSQTMAIWDVLEAIKPLAVSH